MTTLLSLTSKHLWLPVLTVDGAGRGGYHAGLTGKQP